MKKINLKLNLLAMLVFGFTYVFGANNSSFVSQSVPTSVKAGQKFSVTITLNNNGTTTWSSTASKPYFLGALNPQDNTIWGTNRISLPSTVSPGQNVSITFNATAPATPGTYNFQWRMVNEYVEWFGATTPNVAITVENTTSLSVSIINPTNYEIGTLNTGQLVYSDRAYTITGFPPYLGGEKYIRPKNDDKANTSSVFLQFSIGEAATIYVAYDQRATAIPSWLATFTKTADVITSTDAPYAVYSKQYNPGNIVLGGNRAEGGTAASMYFVVTKKNASLINNATFVSQTVSNTLQPGQTFTASFVFRNSGTTTWTNTGTNIYYLGAENPMDNMTWGSNRIALPANVPPGTEVTLSKSFKAPTTPGTYNFQWRMLQDNVQWFGDFSTNIAINVQSTVSSGVTITSVNPAYQVDKLANGKLVYSDRSYTITGFPSFLANQNYIRTNNADKANVATTFLTFNIGQPAKIYVAYDSRATIIPNWLKTFTKTTLQITTSDIPYILYMKKYPVGQVALGGNREGGANGSSMYFVITEYNDEITSTSNAQFISQSIPTTLQKGQNFTATITLKNTGTTTWSSTTGTNKFYLGSVNPTDNIIWGKNRINLPSNVSPNQTVTITLSLTAPATSGTYNFQWRMVHENVEWFGEVSQNVSIKVGTVATSVDASTIVGKVMFGYQGWFACPGDPSGINIWFHYFKNNNTNEPNIDFWPDMTEYNQNELYSTGKTLNNGSPAKLYSPANANAVNLHMKWLKDYNLDGVFVQRFVSDIIDPTWKTWRNNVLINVKNGCEEHGRVYAVMYDITSGQNVNMIEKIKTDWVDLVDKGIVTSPNYLKQWGLPVVAIWGIGFNHMGYAYTPQQQLDVINFLQNHPDPKYRATVMGGVPTQWRTLNGDSYTASGWMDVYKALDILSPWTVGRFADDAGADSYKTRMSQDIAFINNLKPDPYIIYIPVVWPGFSWKNMEFYDAGRTYNQIKRRCGNFIWHQYYNAQSLGVEGVYIAMFDEMDEGTAMFKVAPTQSTVPRATDFSPNRQFVTLDADGCSLPSDWYLRVAGEMGKVLRNERQLTSNLPITPSKSFTEIANVADTYDNFNVYPNPANDHTYIKANLISDKNVVIKIFDIQNRLVFEKSIASNSQEFLFKLDLTNFNKGMYFIQINNNNNSFFDKLIVF